MNKTGIQKVLLALRIITSIFGLYLLFELLYFLFKSVYQQKIFYSLFVPESEFPIGYILIYALLICFGLYLLVYYKTVKRLVAVSFVAIVFLIGYLSIKTDVRGLDSSYIGMGKESLVIYTNQSSNEYVARYQTFLSRTHFYGNKRDSANFIILETPKKYLNRISSKPIKVKRY